jgi:hypothetical protein
MLLKLIDNKELFVDTISPNQSQAEIILFAVDRFFGV